MFSLNAYKYGVTLTEFQSKDFLVKKIGEKYGTENTAIEKEVRSRTANAETILSNLNHPSGWNFSVLSENPNLTWEIIRNFELPDKVWHWTSLSYNLGITIDDIASNIDKPWVWSAMWNRHTVDNMRKYPDLPWDWGRLLNHRDLPIDFIREFIHKPLRWDALSAYHPITVEIVQEFENKWSWSLVACNSYLTIDIIDKFYHKFRTDDLIHANRGPYPISQPQDRALIRKLCKST